MKTLVIGASGIIGNHIVRELLAQGHQVTALSRGQTSLANLEGLDVQKVKADINDRDSLIQAFQGIDWVFHAAAYYPQNTFQKKTHIKQALQGVRNIIAALKNSNVKRLVYTSSLSTIGRAGPGLLANEDLTYDLYGHDPHPYFLVKYLCEEEVKNSVHQKNLPIVIVNPTGCFGPYELKPKQLCLIPQLVEGKIPAYILNDINVVAVSDVAKGHILAAEKGRVGERYILGGHNMTTKTLIHDICEAASVKPPRIAAPLFLSLILGYLSESVAHLFKKLPSFPILGIRFIQYGQHYSIDKAQRELGYTVSPMRASYENAIEWYKKMGYC